MLHRGVFVCFLLGMLIILPLVLLAPQPVLAAADSYVNRYLQASEPVALELDSQGHTRLFSAQDLSAGKVLFEQNCLNCHVGGANLPIRRYLCLWLTSRGQRLPATTSIVWWRI
jgi:hypothetical protein